MGLGHFAGFSLRIIYNAGGISATATAGDNIFFSLRGPAGDYTGAHTGIFRGIFSIYSIIRQIEQAKLQWAARGEGAGGHYIFEGAE